MWMISRTIGKSRGSVQPSRATVSVTGVPGSPRIRPTAASEDMFVVGTPSMYRILSPLWRPAREAGVSGIGETIVSSPSKTLKVKPIPPNVPLVEVLKSLKCFMLKMFVCGSSARRAPLTAR